jgi:hypothetical protein
MPTGKCHALRMIAGTGAHEGLRTLGNRLAHRGIGTAQFVAAHRGQVFALEKDIGPIALRQMVIQLQRRRIEQITQGSGGVAGV